MAYISNRLERSADLTSRLGTGPFFGHRRCLANDREAENMDLSPSMQRRRQSHFHGDYRETPSQRRWRRENENGPRGGFTLVELLVVITIICMLAGLVLGGLNSARNTGREAQTKATITKLHNIIMAKYDSYRTRRVPLTINTTGLSRSDLAKARLWGLRDLMRMEMPERDTDIGNGPTTFSIGSSSLTVVAQPAISKAYAARRTAATGSTLGDDSPAKCLYLIATMLCGAREQFKESEIAAPDSSGFPVFIDGWGKPIYFLRWAPGFNDSDIQPTVDMNGVTASSAALNDHDPFDPLRLDTTAWRLVPLIYSAGPDGLYKIETYGSSYAWDNSTYYKLYTQQTASHYLGSPYESGYYDNIHNHRIEAK